MKRHGSDISAEVDDSKKARQPEVEESTEEETEVESSNTNGLDYLQIIVTGPRKCGKSSLVCTFMHHLLPPKRGEFLSKQYLHIRRDDKPVMIWDLDSRDDFVDYRRSAYPEADVALLCFNIKKPSTLMEGYGRSLDEILAPWFEELDTDCSTTQIILVGLREDLRGTASAANFYCREEIDMVKRHPRIIGYKEVSIRRHKQQTVEDLFTEAIASITAPKPKVMFSKGGIQILGPR